ncbi:LysR family transcriptional regulator [Robertmurraya sp. DFI.2.37]|uniref:LysR family transcriptional regulator n=1 Tax=Robertmurraya sp. DFI.2.37 TaxID=3031819 RepID=UPI001244910E|nr:LysR family transcriptional regulator [Robertmurraya sp. DFI.2.37]MDF1507974.1 LysR family transcriptional regulator [Robertmurraya sp. DFI.2.37]
MDIAELKCFLKVCETKNLTKAAKELYMTQQALSRTIRNLEKEMGAELFYRNSRGVTLTELGTYLHSKAGTLIEQFEQFTNDVQRKIECEHNRLKVGFSPGTLRILSGKEILQLGKEEMGIEIDIFEYNDKVCEANVLAGTLDMALTANPRNHTDFSYSPLMKHQIVAIVNKEHPISKKDSITFTELKNEKLILIDDTFRLPEVVMEHFEKEGIRPTIFSKLSHDLNLAYEFVTLNKGIFIFIGSLTEIESYSAITSIPINVPTAIWEIGFIVKRNTNMNMRMKQFKDLIEERFANY